MSKNTSNPHTKIIIALVVLVAVVTVVIFGFQKNEFSSAPVSEGEEGALAGNAVNAALPGVVLLDNIKINSFYQRKGIQDFSQRTATQVCRDFGKRCVGTFSSTHTLYYSSNDGSCSGEIQMRENHETSTGCDLIMHENLQNCFAFGLNPDEYGEPFEGDYRPTDVLVEGVLCQ